MTHIETLLELGQPVANRSFGEASQEEDNGSD
jgi:hypothetical protein